MQKAEDPLYPADELHGIVGTDVRQPFDMRDIIARIVDGSKFREFKKEYGPTILTVRPSLNMNFLLLNTQSRVLRISTVMKLGSLLTMASFSLLLHLKLRIL